MGKYMRIVRKLQFLNNFLVKNAFLTDFGLRTLARKNAGLVWEPIGFPNKSIFSLLLLLLPVVIYGQGFTGPGPDGQAVMVSQFITVSEARNLPHDSWVVLAGNIINMLPGGRQYTFRDSSGDIAVDIGPKEWRGLSVDVTDKVEIYGEVKIHRGQIHIKVHAITGTGRINIRQGQAVTIIQPITINEARSLPHDSWVVLN